MEFKGHVQLGAGSWDNYRSEVDVSGPLTDSGNIRGRAVAAYQDKKSFMDHYSRKTETYYGITEFDLSPDTMLTVGFDYQDNIPQGSSWSGSFPLVNSNGSINKMPRSYNNGTTWSSWEQNTRTAFAMLEHDLGDGWVTKFQLDHKINGYHADLGSIQFVQPAADGTAEINGQKYTGETKSTSADLYATGPFSLFGREHERWWAARSVPRAGKARATGHRNGLAVTRSISITGTAISPSLSTVLPNSTSTTLSVKPGIT